MRRAIPVAVAMSIAACSGPTDGPSAPDAGGPTGSVPDAAPPPSPDAALAPDAAREQPAFSYLTINLWNAYLNGGDWEARRGMVADAITAWAPDAVCLQEVVDSDSLDNGAELIAAATGYEVYYVQTHEAFVFREGIAVLSPWPIAGAESQSLPITDFGIAERAILAVELATPAGPKRVFCSHMSIDPDEQRKADESVAAWQFMDARRTAGPALFAGDLNAQPDTLAMRVLRGAATHAGVTGDLADAWLAARPTDPGMTHPSDAPEKRIDYVYVVPGDTTPMPAEIDCDRVFTEPTDGVYASDHVGLLCTLRE